MARILRVAMEIMDICNEKNIELDYFKLQKLAYICQCVHFKKYKVPLSPENIYFWSLGGSFKEIYNYFDENEIIKENEITEQIVNVTNKKKHKYGNIYSFERETIDFVLKKYADEDLEDLVELCLNDPLFDKIDIGDIIELYKLSNNYLQNFVLKNKSKTLKYL